MNNSELITKIQNNLKANNIDGWLFYDFRNSDELGLNILNLPLDAHRTRRWFYFIPATGTPTKITHIIEKDALNLLPGEKNHYLKWQELNYYLVKAFNPLMKDKDSLNIAMQYSPNNAIPYVDKISAGIKDLVESCGVKVVTSADLIGSFETLKTEKQFNSHKFSCEKVGGLINTIFLEIRNRLNKNGECTEYEISKFILSEFKNAGLTTPDIPLVATMPNNANPHYFPNDNRNSKILENQLVMIDIWAREDKANSIFHDITWMGYTGKEIPAKISEIFQIVATARDKALEYVKTTWEQSENIKGCDIDDIARNYIDDSGYGEFIKHRTGHSLFTSMHANGAHLDNVETHDNRTLHLGSLFTIEPGIYIDGEFGIRSEINVLITNNGPEVVGLSPQKEIILI